VHWRKEDYTTAGGLIPDELLDAFIVCGTRREIADRAWEYHEAGMDLPILQPVVQDEDQVSAVLDAAVAYGSGEAGTVAARAALGEQRKSAGASLRDRIGAYWEIARPFSFTASTVPVAVGGALAAVEGRFDWTLFLVSLVAGVLLHIGTNVTNEIYDVRKGVDTIVSPRASHAIVKGRISDREAYVVAVAAFALAFALGLYLDLGPRLAGRRARARGTHRRLHVHRAAVPVQVQPVWDPARVHAHGSADGRGLVLRDHRHHRLERARHQHPGRLPRSRRSCTATSGATSARTRARVRGRSQFGWAVRRRIGCISRSSSAHTSR
jgi:hypothetical protein